MESHSYRRRRPPLSCIQCRRRKIKCDRKHPCTHCITSKVSCTYRNPHEKNGGSRQDLHVESCQPLSPTQVVQGPTRLADARKLDEDRTGNQTSQNPARSRVQASASSIAEDSSHLRGEPPAVGAERPANTPKLASNLSDLAVRLERLEQSTTTKQADPPSKNGHALLTLQSGLQDTQIGSQKSRVLRWSQWKADGPEFETILACFSAFGSQHENEASMDPMLDYLNTEVGDLLRECKITARYIKASRPSRYLASPITNLVPPSRFVADTLVSLYFQCFESTHRILHFPTFEREYESYWKNLETAPTVLSLKVLLVVAIGSSLQEPQVLGSEFGYSTHQWVHAAQTWLAGPIEKNRLEIHGLQIHCLVILAQQVLSIGGDLIWMSMGSLIHKSMQIALHRDPKYLPPMSILQAEIRRRLWATILELVVQSSLDAGMPPRVSFDEFDTEAPANVNDSELSESSALIQCHPGTVFSMASLQRLLFYSLPTRLRVVQLLNGLRSELSYLEVLALSSEIVSECQTVGKFMMDHKDSVTPFHQNLVDLLTRRFVLPLHCPFATEVHANPLFAHSRKISVDNAMVIISPKPDESFMNLMKGGGGFVREAMRNASTAISLELLAQTEVQRLDGSFDSYSQYRKLLKEAMQRLISISLERLQRGETNVKSHMFLSMIMAQVQAVEEGTSCELKIAQSAKESLILCHDLLKSRLDNTPPSSTNDSSLIPIQWDEGHDSLNLDLSPDFFLQDLAFD